jgi:2-methylcitrate dehydratase PrpD
VSAACAPAALVVAAAQRATVGEALAAYAEGFEVMAGLAAASHPALYDAGYHPTAVCGPAGAAAVAGALLGLDDAQRERAIGLALLRSGGTRGAFGSDAKAIQVGLAAAAGVQGALLARAGATIDPRATRGPLGFAGVLPAQWPDAGPPDRRGIASNWIKLHPSCLGTHAPIEAADQVRAHGPRGEVTVSVHPTARQAAHIEIPATGLEAKFSIPYCVAHALANGPPGVRDFAAVDPAVAQAARAIAVELDATLPEFGAVLQADAVVPVRVEGPRGSPAAPATADDLQAKLTELAGSRLDGALDDLGAPAGDLLAAAGL